MSRDNRRQAKLYAREQRRLAYQRRHEPPANDASDILEHLLQAVEESHTDDEAQEHLASIREATVRRVLAGVQPKDIIATAIERAAFSPGAKDTDKDVKALLDASRHGKAEDNGQDDADDPDQNPDPEERSHDILNSSTLPHDYDTAAQAAQSKITSSLASRYGRDGAAAILHRAALHAPVPNHQCSALEVAVLRTVAGSYLDYARFEDDGPVCYASGRELGEDEVETVACDLFERVELLVRAGVGMEDGPDTSPVQYKASFEEQQHPRDDDGRFKSGSGSKGKGMTEGNAEGKASKPTTSKPHASPTSPHAPGTAKPKRPTVDDVHEHIERIKHNATPEAVAELASHMEQMTVKQLHELKRKHGLRAGGKKSDLVRKIADRATAKVSRREYFTREARKKGLRPADAHKLASVNRKVHEEYRSQIAHALRTARSNYAHFNPGSALSRSLKPFRQGTGDYNSLPSWDVVTRAVMSESPGLLGYDDMDAMQRLYDMVASGPPVRMPHEESYELAFSELESSPLKDDKKDGKSFEEDFWGDDMPDETPTTTDDDEPIPFAKDAEEDADDNDKVDAFVLALLEHADDAAMREAIVEVMQEDHDDIRDEDDFPATKKSVAKGKAWLDAKVAAKVKEWRKEHWGE